MEETKTFIQRTSGLRARDYFGYAMVDAAGCLVYSLVTTLLQKFYTDIFHLSPLFIMIMFIAVRIFDTLNDPVMGRICDTVKPGRGGRYKQWFLYIAVPLAVCSVFMFIKFPWAGEAGNVTATCIYATVTYVLFGMAYTVVQIPYGILASVVTTDVGERNKLSVFRSIGAALGSVPVLLIASFAYAKRTDASGNAVIGENGKAITDMQYGPVITGVIIMAAATMVMLIISYFLNRERVKTKPRPKEKGALKKALGIVLRDRAFIVLSMAGLLLLAGQMFTQSFYTYLFNDYFHANWMNLVSQFCSYSPMLIFMFILPVMARRRGKKEVTAVGVALAALANLVLFFLRGLDPSVLIWVFLAMNFISGLGLTTLVMQLWAMFTDVVDGIEVRHGMRDDGTSYAMFNFFRKLGGVLAAICVNGALLGMNYKYEKGAVQTLENLKTMYDLATLIPAVLFGIMAVLLFVLYPLSRRKVEELQEKKELKLKENYENNTIEI